MLAILKRSLKDRKTYLLWFIFSVVFLVWTYVAMYPSIREQSANFNKLLETYPDSFKKIFKIETMDFSHLENFISIEQFSFTWPLLVIFIALSFGANSIAGEVEKGTIEVLLSQPISRAKIFIGKYLSGLIGTLSFVFVSIYAIIPIAKIYDIDYKLSNFNTTFIISALFALAIMSVAYMASAFSSDKGRVYFITAGLLVAMYVANIVSALKESLADLKYASFFYYFDAQKSLVYNQIDSWSYLVFGSIIIGGFLVGLWKTTKRDLIS